MWLTLEFDKVAPLQWLTNNFMHADILHLVGNMFFLWGFGLVIEGKLGWWRFFCLYLVVGLIYGAIVQITMLLVSDGTGLALGASGALFGLMAIAVVWAPQSEMNCFMWAGIFSRIVQISIITFGLIYLAFQVFFFIISGYRMSSEALASDRPAGRAADWCSAA